MTQRTNLNRKLKLKLKLSRAEHRGNPAAHQHVVMSVLDCPEG